MNDGTQRYRAPFQIILMLVIIVATIIAGFVMVPGNDEERRQLVEKLGTVNHGKLVSPLAAIEELPLKTTQGEPWHWQDQAVKWRLIIPAVACDAGCKEMLYLTRQVHIRLAKKSPRVERLFLSLDGPVSPAVQQFLDIEHPHVPALSTDKAAMRAWLADTNVQWSTDRQVAFLVDPLGRAMMVYDLAIDGNDMLEDLNHLLSFSPD